MKVTERYVIYDMLCYVKVEGRYDQDALQAPMK